MDTPTKYPPMRLRVELPAPVADALREAALLERRSMPEQAAWMLERTLRRRVHRERPR
jgi:hypothetical protein